jgi:hypothetical protein
MYCCFDPLPLRNQFIDPRDRGVGDRQFATVDEETLGGVDTHRAEIRVEQVCVIDFAVDHLRPILVRLADDRTGLNLCAAE